MDDTGINISRTVSVKVPSGIQYSNSDHSMTVTKRLVIPPDLASDENFIRNYMLQQLTQLDEELEARAKDIYKRWENIFAQKDLVDGRDYYVIDDVRYPRVTKIITPDTPSIPYLDDHGELGTHLDKCCKVWVESGVWAYQDFADKGNIKQVWDDLYLRMSEWIDLYGSQITFEGHSKRVINNDFLYCGEMDAWGRFGSYRAIFDFKKTEKLNGMKEKYYKQMAAYAMALPKEERPQCMVIISPFNEPVPECDIEKYWNLFLVDRGRFDGRFGL